jgi:pyrimidine-specific ribonucleoside hydrolase
VGTFKGSARGGRFDGGPLFPRGGGGGESDGGDWAGAVYDAYPRRVGLADTVPDGVAVYREALAGQPDGSVTIITTGMLTVVSELLQSPPDAIDPRSGHDLVADTVSRIVVMGTREPNSGSPEFNMRHSPGHASHVAAESPVPIWWMPFFQGHQVFTGRWTGAEHQGHIVRFGLEAFNHVPGADGNGRQSWDAMTVLLAVRGDAEPWQAQAGTMAIDARNGASTWTADPQGRQRLWTTDASADYFEGIIEPLIW